MKIMRDGEGKEMSKLELRNMQELDEVSDWAGVFLAPLTKGNAHYDYRALFNYCREKK